jgi:hypothetical protein
MARKKPVAASGYVLFDIVYQDGTRSSNRKVPSREVGGLDGDKPARAYIEAQDREIGLKSGNPRGPIKTIVRSPKQS